MITGKQREQKEFVRELFVGFTSVKVAAFNPTREELNTLLGREPKDEDKPLEYLGQDTDGNQRLRVSFWLLDEVKNRFIPYSFNITNKERKNKDGDKVQLINATCSTTWAPYVEGTDEPNEELIQDWFCNFVNKEKEVLGKKKWRKALAGEEELGTLLRAWLGKINFNDVDTEVLIDMKALFKGNYSEISDLINSDYSTSFVSLLGVRTDVDEPTKKYQQVWGKAFLPNGFLPYIQKGLKFPSDYSKNIWKKFEEGVSGEYGFDSYHELCPIKEYDETTDPAAGSRKVSDPKTSDY